jgi:hypothetical protein
MSTTVQRVDQAKLDEFLGRFVGDLGAALSAALVVIGELERKKRSGSHRNHCVSRIPRRGWPDSSVT